MAKKATSKRVASEASKALRDKRTGDRIKSVAASALSQTKLSNTSEDVASEASSLLRDKRTGARTKAVAGSALSQAKSSKE